jgi:hypothetical protein
VNRLKKSYDQGSWNPNARTRAERRVQSTENDSQEEEEVIPSRQTVNVEVREPQVVVERPLTPPTVEQPWMDTPAEVEGRPEQAADSTLRDPKYVPSRSPCSMRELNLTPHGPPLTPYRARLQIADRNEPATEQP